MKAAIVGYAQAGKKTLFKLLTNRDVPQGRKEDEAVEGAASVYDVRVETLAKICKPQKTKYCLLYTSPSPRDRQKSRMPSSA